MSLHFLLFWTVSHQTFEYVNWFKSFHHKNLYVCVCVYNPISATFINPTTKSYMWMWLHAIRINFIFLYIILHHLAHTLTELITSAWCPDYIEERIVFTMFAAAARTASYNKNSRSEKQAISP